jgi:hypothetical protein
VRRDRRAVRPADVQGPAEGVGGEDVEPAVADERRRFGHAVEDELDGGPDLQRRAPASGPGGAGVRRAGKVLQVEPLGFVELERAGDRVRRWRGPGPWPGRASD